MGTLVARTATITEKKDKELEQSLTKQCKYNKTIVMGTLVAPHACRSRHDYWKKASRIGTIPEETMQIKQDINA